MGSKGATLQRPGWAGNHIRFYPFPTSSADETRKVMSAARTKGPIRTEAYMARVRNLHRIDLYCPEYMTNATILIDQNPTPANLISWLATRWAASRPSAVCRGYSCTLGR